MSKGTITKISRVKIFNEELSGREQTYINIFLEGEGNMPLHFMYYHLHEKFLKENEPLKDHIDNYGWSSVLVWFDEQGKIERLMPGVGVRYSVEIIPR